MVIKSNCRAEAENVN